MDKALCPRSRRNRVNPFGEFEAVPSHGTLMGNRGDLHNNDGSIGRKWKLKRWISCILHSPTGHRVAFDTPGRYTPLFFADEVTALAAGHRPCAECRRGEYDRFRQGWQVAFGAPVTAAEMDETLHRARIDRHGRKITFEASLGDLPDGTFVATSQPALIWNGALHPWAHAGYDTPRSFNPDLTATVLTPAPTVAVLHAGYRPQVALREIAGIAHFPTDDMAA
ncbi:hypothetical protein CCGE525_13395 [Rhizobium jaguaris]|uniref:Uncharacterized protein n=2 Tax=Rhizobium jaguaris TaxID=1312183 RepID=A0A387FSK8_9HYPH|nr:hypothetical protein CCGE525_13395 [Rhizobium jaguaris]